MDLRQQLRAAFDDVEKPSVLCPNVSIISDATSATVLDGVDWQRVQPKVFPDVSDSLVYLSPKGFRYLAPRMLCFVLDHGEDAVKLDVVDTFFHSPLLRDGSKRFGLFSKEQRNAFFEAYLFILEEYEDESFPSVQVELLALKAAVFD